VLGRAHPARCTVDDDADALFAHASSSIASARSIPRIEPG
jgi:hypothetical protein